MPAVPIADPDTEATLDAARSQAAAGLKGRFPDSMLAPPPPAQPKVTNSITNSVGNNLANSQQVAPVAPEPGPEAQPIQDTTPTEPPPDAVAYGAEAKAQNTAGRAIGESTKALGSEVGNGLMRGAVNVARTLGFAAAGLNNIMSAPTDEQSAKDPGAQKRDNAIFDFVKNHVDTAYDTWKNQGPTNAPAQTIGSVAEGAAPMLLGGAGAGTMIANATVNAGKESVDAGDNTKTAVAMALINGVSTTAQVKIGYKDPSAVKRIAKWIGAGELLDQAGKATEVLVRHILADESYQEAAKKVDPLNPTEMSITALMQTIFGILHTPKIAPYVKAADPQGQAPGPDAVPVKAPDLTAGTGTPPPPPEPAQAAKPVAETPATPNASASPIKDTPSAEPRRDLEAQVADMKNPNTPRKAVYLSADNVAQLGPEGIKALADGAVVTKNFDRNGGVLISPDHSERSKATALRKAEPDMQKVLGQLTGAGDGKSPDQTQVVQGQTPEGAVATETAVAPHEVAGAVADATAQGHTPIVTTPEAAIARRADEVKNEVPATPVEHAKPVVDEHAPEVASVPGEPKAGERHIIKIAGEDVPVVIAGDPVDNKVPVHTIDDDGRLSKDARNVPLEMFKPKGEDESPTPAAAAEHATEDSGSDATESSDAATAEPDSPLAQAAKLYDTENTPPAGKKFAGSVKEHAERTAALGRALDTYLKSAKDLPDNVREHAERAARRVIRMDQKSDEQMAKNQGVGHGQLDRQAEDIKRAIRNIEKPAEAVIPERVQDKAEKLKARLAKEREAAAKPKETPKPVAEEPKVKSAIPDVEDIRKPKTLNAGEKIKAQRALKRYLEADEDHVGDVHNDVEKVLREIYGPDRGHEADSILELAREQRAELQEEKGRGPRRLSETMEEDELKGHDYDDAEHDRADDWSDGTAHEGRAQSIYANTPIGRLAAKLKGTGLYKQMATAKDNGTFLSTHKVLGHLAEVARGDAPMSALIAKLRAHVPDLPLRPVDAVIHPSKGSPMEGAAGLFHPGSNTLQVKINGEFGHQDTATPGVLHALLHEITHAATSYELHLNPVGPFATEVHGLLQEAKARAQLMGEADHYGLTDPHEFIAETLTNPKFQDFLARSEGVAVGKRPAGGARGLFDRVAMAIGKLLGVKNPAEAGLLRDAMDLAQRGMEEQTRNQGSRNYAGRADALERLKAQGAVDHMPGLDQRIDDMIHMMAEPPRPLENENEYKRTLGDAATGTARLFRRAVRSGAVETVRRTVRAFTPYDGLVRAALRRGVFGHADASNPLRHYDNLVQERNAVSNRMAHEADPIVNDRAKLSYTDNKKLGQFQIDSTKLGIDPEADPTKLPAKVKDAKGFQGRWDDMQARWKALTDGQKDIYRRERDWNEKSMRANRRAGVDVALDSFTDKQISKAQRQLLYSVTNPHDFDQVIGKGKPIDVGTESNGKLVDALRDLSSTMELEGPYFHLGRHGEHVVQISPEGIKTFSNEAAARAYGDKIKALSPGSKAKVAEVGGKWQVDYKAEYVSMHNSPAEADAEVERLKAEGHDVGSVTQKVLSDKNAPLSSGMQHIFAEATRRMDKYGSDDAIDASKEALRNAFVNLMAARSSYAGSKLARRNVGGVKPEEMGRNFATHAQSLSWNTAHMGHVFKIAEALGKLREAAKDQSQVQAVASQRGRVYDEIQRRMRQEVEQYGSHVPFNSAVAKLGFMNYMTSVSHAMIYLTQNFTTAIPRAGAKFGYYKATKTFGDAMAMTSGPAFREAYRAALLQSGHDVNSIQKAILKAVESHPRFGKWAAGGKDSPLQQLIDRGIIHTSLSNQLATTAKGGSAFVNRVMEWARILPSMADMFNRVSSGVAALELHKGDVYKAGDFVKETHIDYSQENKPRAFRAVNRVWGGNSVTMFKSYMTGMAHLLYSHVYDAVAGGGEGRLGGREEALKTVAGLIIGSSLFAGVQRGAGLEPIRAAVYAYHKLVGDNSEYNSFDNMTRRAVSSMTGGGKIAEAINGGLPRLAGFDMSSRLGLSDLMLHDPPDLLSMDKGEFAKFGYSQLGPIAEMLANSVGAFSNAMQTGRVDDAAKILPIKAAHNVIDAYTAATQGKQTSTGAQITQPSIGAGISHLIGFRTAEEARLSEKLQTDSEYKTFAANGKYALVAAYTKMDPSVRAEFFSTKIKQWNEDNPGHRISFSDLRKQSRSIANTERVATGQNVRDPVINKLNED